MRFRKIVICCMIVCSMLLCPFNSQVSAGKYGIEYNPDAYSAKFVAGQKRMIRTYDSGVIIGKTQYTLARLRQKVTSGAKKGKIYKSKQGDYEDVIVVKMDVYPQKHSNKKMYGVAEYLKCAIALPDNITTVNSYSPRNQPKSSTWNIGVNAGGSKKDGGTFGVSASTEVKVKDLDVDTNVDITSKVADFIYDYKPHKTLSWSKTANKYVRSSSTQYAMIDISTRSYSSLKFNLKCNYTYALDKNAKPLNVVWGSQKATGSYTWKF